MTRQSSNHNFPSSVNVIPVDYDSIESLTNALNGQDAVVSVLASAAIATQLLLVEAAAKALVKLFIPSEFGSNTQAEKTRALPIFKDKILVQDALKKEADSGRLTYTFISTGPFLDFGISLGFIINLKEKSANLYDGGDRVFSATSLPTIGKAVVGVLKHPEETKNRAVYVQDTATTLKHLTALGKKATGAEGWTETEIAIDDLLEEAWAELKKPQPNPANFAFQFIRASIFGEGYGSHFQKLDNELLGIQELNDSELQALVDRLAK